MTSTSSSSPTLLARSWIFTPATLRERFGNARKNGADVLIVDLEDAVAPEKKTQARDNVRALLNAARDGQQLPLIAVRINTRALRNGVDDLVMLLEANTEPDFVILPKIESPEEVVHVQALMSSAGKRPALVPMIESARGRFDARSIAAACPAVTALMFGAADYASDVRAQPSSLALQIARCELAAACAEAGIVAIDSPCFALHDPAQLALDLQFATDNGFSAKAAIHPSHVEAINATFTPSPERLDWARRVIAASEQGAGTVDGRMVDEAIAREARRVVAFSSPR